MKLGDKVRSKVTGLTGICTAIAENLTGCRTIYIQPPRDENMKDFDGAWVDIHAVEVVEAGAVQIPRLPRDPADAG